MDCYQIKSRVIYENMDHEVIIINFNTGDYYSLRETAKLIWSCIENNISVSHIITAFVQRFPIQIAQIEQDLKLFFQQLMNENLIEPSSSIDNSFDISILLDQSPFNYYVQPVLQKYSDIDQLLLLDPIHDVDNTGWPNQVEA